MGRPNTVLRNRATTSYSSGPSGRRPRSAAGGLAPPPRRFVDARCQMARRSAISRNACRPVLSQPCFAPCSRHAFPAGLACGVDPADRRNHGGHILARSGEPGRYAMNGALVGIAAAVVLALGLGFLAGRGCQAEHSAPLVFLLMAGEIYTTFTFLGGSGFAYGKGGPAYYVLCYGTLAYVISYFMLPAIWRYGHENRLFSQPDFFVHKY